MLDLAATKTYWPAKLRVRNQTQMAEVGRGKQIGISANESAQYIFRNDLGPHRAVEEKIQIVTRPTGHLRHRPGLSSGCAFFLGESMLKEQGQGARRTPIIKTACFVFMRIGIMSGSQNLLKTVYHEATAGTANRSKKRRAGTRGMPALV